jgi:NAD(P)-dependent dehydrogenase (short-subunit alcohol dehydrogenase family)
MAAEGAAVACVDLRAGAAETTVKEIDERGGMAAAFSCDVRVRADVESAVTAVVAGLGRLDILVTAALGPVRVVPIEATTDRDLEELWRSGVLGVTYCMQAASPHLRASGHGRVINFGSGAGVGGPPGYAAYAPVKEAVRALTRVASHEWGEYGITVNAICPYANSPGWKEWADRNPEFLERALAGSTLGRVGDCEDDIGRSAVFLASDDAAFITGHTLMVDGGQTHL